MRTTILAAALLVLAGTAVAQDRPNNPPHQSRGAQMATSTAGMAAETAAISTLEGRWTAALLAKDQATLEELLAPEFQLVGVRSTGVAAMSRDSWLATAGSIVFHDFKTETTSVQLFGDTALATVEGHWDIVFGGRPIKEHFYVTDIWVRRDGRWRVVRRHSSPYQAAVPAPAQPGT